MDALEGFGATPAEGLARQLLSWGGVLFLTVMVLEVELPRLLETKLHLLAAKKT